MVADDRQPILAHLEEFRWRIVKIAAAIFGGAMVALLFANRIRLILEAPYDQVCGDSCQLQALTATEQFSVLMKVAVFGGVVLASPVVLYQIWAFINPALTVRERRWAVPIIAAVWLSRPPTPAAIVVVAAAITPTGDALTLTLLSVPLYLFYEVTYWLVRLLLRK